MYYVYCYKDPVTLVPFYIGKGKWSNQRHLDHLKETLDKSSNRHKYYKIKSIINKGMYPIIEIVQTNMDEDTAYRLEENLIRQYGKQKDKTGTLTNICDKAHPPSPKGRVKTQAHRDALSKAHMGKVLSEVTKQRILETKRRNGTLGIGRIGKYHTEATKRKISESKKGTTNTVESNMKRSEALKGRKQPTTTCYKCGKVGSISQIARWHNKNCRIERNTEQVNEVIQRI